MRINSGQQVPVNVVGSSIFGRYPKISLEKTYNMFISDEWLVNYAGFQNVAEVLPPGEGRALFHSIRGQFLIAVISSSVYRLNANLSPQFIGNISTNTGEVFIDENLSSQICIVDGQAAYIYSYIDNTLTQQTLTFLGNTIIPNYVCYHNTFFLIASAPQSINSQNWYAFQFATNDTISLNTQFSLQTKPDSAIAVKRIPGRGNNVIVFGSTVAEVWTQVGGIENYRRVSSFNIDSGCVNVATIAANEEFVCWLAQNENNAPSIFVSNGASVNRISSDGIDYLMQTIVHPEDSTAFFFRQDGHLFYQLTFFNTEDNVTLFYDFTTQKFYHASDEDLNFHPARQIVYFNEDTYFVSLNDGNIYQMGTQFVIYNYNLDPTVQGDEIPRIRICKTIRREDSSRFRVWQFTFWLEQGVTTSYLMQPFPPVLVDAPRVDLSFSKNGNQSFSNIVGNPLNPRGLYQNQIRWDRMGQANEFTIQLRFWGFQRFVAKDGFAELVL
jgi:hypothetical protein